MPDDLERVVFDGVIFAHALIAFSRQVDLTHLTRSSAQHPADEKSVV